MYLLQSPYCLRGLASIPRSYNQLGVLNVLFVMGIFATALIEIFWLLDIRLLSARYASNFLDGIHR